MTYWGFWLRISFLQTVLSLPACWRKIKTAISILIRSKHHSIDESKFDYLLTLSGKTPPQSWRGNIHNTINSNQQKHKWNKPREWFLVRLHCATGFLTKYHPPHPLLKLACSRLSVSEDDRKSERAHFFDRPHWPRAWNRLFWNHRGSRIFQICSGFHSGPFFTLATAGEPDSLVDLGPRCKFAGGKIKQ